MKRGPVVSRIARYSIFVFVIVVSMGYTTVRAQNIFLNKKQFGILALGGYGASNKYGGSVMGFGVSFNGFTDIGMSFSKLSHKGIDAIIFGIAPDFLLKKQSFDSPVNVELSPGFTHTYYRSHYYGISSGSSIISFGMAVSHSLESDPGVHMIPQLHLRYGITLTNISGDVNLFTTGLDWNVAIDLSDHVVLVFDPGITVAINENSTAGSIAGGFLIN